MTSLGTMVKMIAGLAGANDVDSRTNEFIESIIEQTDDGRDTTRLSEKQVAWIEDIHRKHFAG